MAGALVCLAVSIPAAAQEMEPKAYSASPVGANFLVSSFTRSTGAIVFDPALPISDIQAGVNGLVVGVGHTMNLFGKLGLVSAGLPMAWAHVTGNVFEEAKEVQRNGFGDMRLKLSVNLRGNPAMSPREFRAAGRHTIVGASVAVVAPTGQYNGTKLINVGSNRWAIKPEVGVSVPKGHWDLDAYMGLWFFAANGDFFPGGARRTQERMVAIQGHGSYTVKPRFWIAGDATWYHGGSSRVGDGDPSVALNNSRLGVTTSFPLGRRYSLKAAYSGGMLVRTGSNFRTLSVAFQALWLSPRWSGR